MNEGWRLARLGDVCSFEKEQAVYNGLPYVGLENIESGTGRFVGTTNAVSVKSATFRFSPAHVLYGRLRPYLNKVLIPDFDGHCSTEIFPIRAGREVSREYLFHWLSMDATVKSINATSTGARMPRANMNAVLDFELPVPPMPEQRRIVAILEEAFECIATAKVNAEKSLRNAHELFSSRMQVLFGQDEAWERVSLEELLARGWISGHLDGNHGSDYPRKEEFVDAGVPYIAASAIKGGIVDFDEAKYLSPQRAASIRKGLARDRDVLFAHNATVGPVAILKTDEPVVILGTSLTYYRCDPQHIHPEYLAHFMLSPTFTSQYAQVMKQSTRNQVPITKQREFFHVVPPVDVQRRIADDLDELSAQTERLADIAMRKLIALDELKKSLLHQAFTGQLTSAKTSTVAAVIAIPTTSPEFSANIIALAYERHKRQNRERTFGHVKEQKLLHLVENISKVNLGRQPMKDAAGPNDFPHMLKAEEWAKRNEFFEMVQRDEGGYDFKKLPAFDKLLAKAPQVLGAAIHQIESVIDLLVPMDTVEAEVLATVHAAWNNLLIDGAEITDAALIREARDGWHADKLAIPESKFRQAIALIRSKGLVPDGTGKYVGGQTALL